MGLVIVAVQARNHGYDLLADPLGWILVLYGLRQLPRSLPWWDSVTFLGRLALVVSVVVWFPTVVDTLSDTDDSLLWAANLPQVAFATTLCLSLARAATEAADRQAASWLKTAATLSVAAGLFPIVVYSVEPDLLVPLLLLAAVSLVMVIVLLFRYHARPWALPEEHPVTGG